MPSTMRHHVTHFGCIDAMRGIAAICVAIFHYTRLHLPEAGLPEISVALADVPYSTWLSPIYTHGEDFVRLFWVISGFVFAHVYWQRDTSARDFAVARFARLYPLHFVTLILVAVMQIISMKTAGHWQIVENNDLRHFILQLFLMDSSLGFSNGNSFNAPIWSVSAEVFVYVLFFATLPFTKRNPLAASGLLAMISFALLAQRPEGFIIGQWVFICSVFFFAGSSCYAMYRALGGVGPKLVAVIIALCGLTAAGGLAGNNNMVLLSSCSATVLALAAVEHIVRGGGRVLRFLGDISYSLYLVHIPLQIVALLIVDLMFDGDRSFANHPLTLPIYLAGSILVAYLANVYFEKPMGRWLRKRLERPAP